VAGWHAVQFIGQPPAMLLNGAGRAGVVAKASVACIAASLALCTWLGESHGTVGVMVALAAPYVLLNLPLVWWESRRSLRLIGHPTPTA
jgi:O-antigen/teichoic acid export membrane protein